MSIGQDQFPMSPGVDYAHLLKGFPCVLVREKTASRELGLISPDKRFEVVLDPTLLLSREEWLSLAAESQVGHERPYVFVYAVGETRNSVAAAKEIAGKRSLEVVVLQQNGFLPIPGVTNLFSISPADFLSYVANAEAVVTSSFHGACLSIQFERDFFVSYAEDGVKRNSRMSDLLDVCGLERRTLDGSLTDASGIDWLAVRRRLEVMRTESLGLLFGSLGGAAN